MRTIRPQKSSALALAGLLEQVTRRIHAQGYSHDLFPAQWVALRYFAKSPRHLRTAADLARYQGLASGAVARTVRTLIQKGFLAKAGGLGRGRAEGLELTQSGKDLLGHDPLLLVADAIEDLSVEDKAAFARSLELVIGNGAAEPIPF